MKRIPKFLWNPTFQETEQKIKEGEKGGKRRKEDSREARKHNPPKVRLLYMYLPKMGVGTYILYAGKPRLDLSR